MADRGTQSGGNGGGRGVIPLGAGSQTVKGVLLIGAAIVLGIVLLQIIDPGTSGPADAARQPTATTTTKPATTTTTAKKTTSTTSAKPVLKPAQVKLIVMNAGAPSGSAATVSSTLRGKGYTNQGAPGNTTHRTGTVVLCKAALTREAQQLVVLLGPGTTKGLLGTPAPAGTTGYMCVVEVGAG